MSRSGSARPIDPGLHLRRFGDDDLDATAQLWHEVKRDAYPYLPLEQGRSLEQDRAFLQTHVAPRCQLWLAETGGELVGFLALEGDYVDRLYVRVDRQRSGIGGALLNLAKRLSPQRLRLHTHQKNASARAFYEKHGFAAVRFGVSPAPESEPDVEYHWEA